MSLRHCVPFLKIFLRLWGDFDLTLGEVVLLQSPPIGTASFSVQVLLQLDDLTIFTPKGHTPLVEQITLQVKAGTIPSAKLVLMALIGVDDALV